MRTAFEPTKWPILDITSGTYTEDDKHDKPKDPEDKPKSSEDDVKDKETTLVKEEAPSIEKSEEEKKEGKSGDEKKCEDGGCAVTEPAKPEEKTEV